MVSRGAGLSTASFSGAYQDLTGKPVIPASASGVVADGSTDQTAHFAAWVTALKAASAYGAVGFLAPSSSSYVGSLVLSGNYGIKISGYGAKLSVPDGGIGVDVAGVNGGSSLGWKVEGLLIKGATTNTTGVRVTDTDVARFRDVRIEDVNTGWLLRASSSAAWVEGTTISDCFINHCAIGVDFNIVGGGSTSFDQTFISNLGINKATTAGVRLGTGVQPFRTQLDYTCWVDTGGAALDTDCDMTGVFGRVMAEGYSGSSGPAGIRARANATGWDKCALQTRLQGSLNPLVDTTTMTNGQTVVLREGNRFLAQSKSSATADAVMWQIATYSQSFPVMAAVRTTASLIPGGDPGFVFGSGTAAYDTYITRPTGSTYARLESNAVLTIASLTSGTRPAASAARTGAFYWDSTLKRMCYSDTVNWRGGNGNTTKTANYTLTSGDENCAVMFNGTSLTATLPTAVSFGTGRLTIKNINVSSLTLATTSSQTIDGAAPGTLAQWAAVTVVSDGANWMKV